MPVGREAGERLELLAALAGLLERLARAGPPPSAGGPRAGASAPPPWSGSARRARPCRSPPLRRPLPAASPSAMPDASCPKRHAYESSGAGNVRADGRGCRTRLIDVLQRGRERVIGAWDLGGAIVDPGPESRIETLLAGLAERAAGAAPDPHPPRSCGRRRARWWSGSRTSRSTCTRGARRTWSTRRGCCKAPSASTATRWRRCGAAWCPCRSATCASLEGGETHRGRGPRARRRVHARPRLPPRRVLRPLRRHRLRRRRRRGADPAVRLRARARRRRPDIDVEAWQRSIDLVAERRPPASGADAFRHGRGPAAAPRADEAGASTSRPSSCASCWSEHGDTRRGGRRLRRGGASGAAARRSARSCRRVRGRRARWSSCGGPAPLLAQAAERGHRRMMATETVERPRVGGPGTGGEGPWRVIVLNDNHNTFDHVAKTLAQRDPERQHRPGLPVRGRDPQHRPRDRVVRRARAGRALLGAAQRRRADDGSAGAGLGSTGHASRADSETRSSDTRRASTSLTEVRNEMLLHTCVDRRESSWPASRVRRS